MSDIQAFPIVIDSGQGVEWHKGMTLRDYIAVKAMMAFISTAPHGTQFGEECSEINMQYAIVSYEMADAMLKAREEA